MGRSYEELNKHAKPSNCTGCPLYGVGASFARTDGTGRNGVALVGEALGETEALTAKPFQGDAGYQLNSVLHRANLKRDDFLIMNTINCHPPNNYLDGAPYELGAIQHCDQYFQATLDSNPQIRVLVAMGNTALYKLLGQRGVKNWHGSINWSDHYGRYVVPTLHPSAVLRGGGKEFPTLLHDVLRAVQLGHDGKFERSPIDYILRPSLDELRAFVAEYESQLALDSDTILAADIETNYSSSIDEDEFLEKDPGNDITRISFSFRPNTAITISWQADLIPACVRLLDTRGELWFHNGNKFDVPRLRAAGAPIANARLVDSMDAWHVLYPDLPRSLGYVAPFFIPDVEPWKHLNNSDPEFYSCRDADYLYRIAIKLREAHRKAGTWNTFLKYWSSLEPRLQRMSEIGIGVNEAKRQEREAYYEDIRDNTAKRLQSLIPAELKPRAKEAQGGYKGKPKDVRAYIQEHKGEIKDESEAWTACGYTQHLKSSYGRETCADAQDIWVWDRVLPFNHNSTDQIKNYLRFKYGPGAVPKHKKTGSETTGADELERIARRYGDEVLNTVLMAGSADSFISSFIKPWTPGPDGRVHGTYTNQPSTPRLASQQPNCFSADTEVLTKRGWVLWPDLTKEDLVAEFCPVTHLIRFSKPEAYWEQTINGELLHISSEQQIDLLVTEDHDCLLQTRRFSFYKEKARNYSWDRKQYNAGYYVGGTVELRNSQLVLLAALQADGSVNSNSGAIDWGFSKKRKAHRLKEALDAEHIPYTVCSTDEKRFYISGNNVPEWLREKKTFGPWLLELSNRAFAFIANEIWFWDGCISRRSMFSSSVKKNADWAQILTGLVNRRARVRKYDATSGNPNWQVDASNREYTWTTNTSIERIPYNDKIYCVTMPLGTVIVRRNGKMLITGQCQNFPIRNAEAGELRKMIWGGEGWPYIIERDYSGIEAILVGWYAKDEGYMRCAYHGIHSFLAAKKLGIECELSWSDADLKLALREAKRIAKKTRVAGSDLYDCCKRTVHGPWEVFDSKVLTPQGWVRMCDYTEGTPIAEWDNGQIYFRVPKTIIRGTAEKLIEYDGTYFKTAVTPEHGMPVVENWSGRRVDVETKDLDSNFTGFVSGKFAFGKWEAPVRLSAAIQADATLYKNQAVFHLVKPRKIARLLDILKEFPDSFYKRPCGCHENGVRISVHKEAVEPALSILTNKQFNEGVLQLTQECAETLLNEVFYWDGTSKEWANTNSFFSTSETSVRWIQTVAHLLGKRATFVQQKHTSGFGTTFNFYKTSVTDKATALIPKERKEVEYNGPVMCFTTQSGYFLVNCRDTIVVSCNSNYLEGALLLHKTFPEIWPTTALAQRDQDFYFEVVGSKIRKWQQAVIDQLHETCYVENAWHIKRWLYAAKRWTYKKRLGKWVLEPGDDAKKGIATIPQGSAGMIMRGALLSDPASELLERGCLMLTIHDSLVARARDAKERDWVDDRLKAAMEYAIPELGGIVIKTEAKIGPDWGSVKEI